MASYVNEVCGLPTHNTALCLIATPLFVDARGGGRLQRKRTAQHYTEQQRPHVTDMRARTVERGLNIAQLYYVGACHKPKYSRALNIIITTKPITILTA